jgi:mRNA-degrading endonuclease RelE of RelBE toxin-antitoxin system
MAVEVRITPSALSELSALHEPILARVNGVIDRLHNWPNVSGAKPLRAALRGSFRVRTGDWRIIFRVAGHVLTITAISNRKDAYED